MSEYSLDPDRPRAAIPRLRARGVVGETISVWLRTLPQLLLVAVIVHGPVLAVRWWLRGAPADKSLLGTLQRLVPYLQVTILSRIVEALATRLVFERVRGEPTDVARSILEGLRRIGAVLGIAVVTAVSLLAVPIATIFVFLRVFARSDVPPLVKSAIVIVPFLFVGFAYLLVFVLPVPAALVERVGTFRAFTRSWILTRGSRFAILRIWFLFVIVAAIASRLLRAILPKVDAPTAFLVGGGIECLFASLGCVLPIVLYHDLRERKEGIGIAELLKVFE